MEANSPPSAIVRVILVEDDPVIRKMASAELNMAPGIECIAAFESAEALKKALPDLEADIVLMDIGLPQQSGIECVRELSPLYRDKAPDFVMYTQFSDRKEVFDALEAGAVGYVLKPDSPEVIAEELRSIRAGGAPMSPQIARMVVERFHSLEMKMPGFETLTLREREVLKLLMEGLSYKEIADRLFIAVSTVRTHIKNIYRKLGGKPKPPM